MVGKTCDVVLLALSFLTSVVAFSPGVFVAPRELFSRAQVLREGVGEGMGGYWPPAEDLKATSEIPHALTAPSVRVPVSATDSATDSAPEDMGQAVKDGVPELPLETSLRSSTPPPTPDTAIPTPAASPAAASATPSAPECEQATELTRYKMRASLLEQALFAQRSRLDAAQSSLRVLEQEAVSVAEELALAADAVRESEAAAQVEAEALKGENFVLQSDLSDARVRVAQESAARVAALAEAADVRSQLEVAIEVSRGAEEVAAAAEENAARFRDRSVLLQNHMLQARERCASLLAQLADTTVQLEELTATNVALRAAASASEGAVCALREEVESLQARVVLAKREAGAAEAGLCDARGNIAALTEALAAAQKDEAAAALVGGVNKADVQALREQLASTQDLLAAMGSDVGAGAVAGAVRGGMDYLIAGDLRDQRRTLEQQTRVLRSLLTAVEGGVDGIGGRGRGMDVSRGLRPEDFEEAQARAIRTPPRLGLVRVARRLFGVPVDDDNDRHGFHTDPIAALSRVDFLIDRNPTERW